MRSGTSFYNTTLARQFSLRFWPLWALLGVIWAIALPLRALMMSGNASLDLIHAWVRALDSDYYQLGLVTAPLFGCLAAMAVCSHLYSTRSANFTAALPPRRTALFATHYLTGLGWLLAAPVVMTLLTLPIVWNGITDPAALFRQVAVVLLEIFFFYTMAVLCGALTGHILALPAFFIIFNGLVFGVWYLLSLIFGGFLHGYPGLHTLFANSPPVWVEWCTPLAQFGRRAIVEHRWWVAGVYGLVAVVMALVAWRLYKARPMERAGDVLVWRGLHPLFLAGVSLCGGMALGVLTTLILSLEKLGLAVATVLWAMAGFLVARMLLNKTVRVLRHWKGACLMGVLFAVFFLVLQLDLTGYETRVPQADQVVSARISGLYNYPSWDDASMADQVEITDPEALELVCDLHRACANKEYQASDGGITSFSVIYRLSNGTTLSRSYNEVYIPQWKKDTEGSISQVAQDLVNSQGYLTAAYRLDQIQEWEADGYRFQSADLEDPQPYYDLTLEQSKELLEAVKQDLEEGNLPRDLWSGDQAPFSLNFFWRKTYSNGDTGSNYIRVAFTKQATHTMALLESYQLAPTVSITEEVYQ